MKRLISLMLSVMVLALIAFAALSEESQGTVMYVYTKNGKVLRVRSSMSKEDDSNVIGSLPYGAKVIIYGVRNGWAMIDYGDTTGYIMSRFLVKKKPAPFQFSDSSEQNTADSTGDASETGEKTYREEHPGVLSFDSCWVSGDAQVRMDAYHTDGGYEIRIVEMTGENTFNSWEYLLTYDEETKSLVADKTGMKSSNTFDQTGAVTDFEKKYEDGSARFFLNDQGQLRWEDEEEDTFSETVFNRIGRFPGRYVYDRAYMEVNWTGEGLKYDVTLDWADSAFETWQWKLSGHYDPATDTLALNGVRSLCTYMENGEPDPNGDRQEEEVSAVFAFDNEGYLVVPESTDPAIMGYRYERDHAVYGMWMWKFDNGST